MDIKKEIDLEGYNTNDGILSELPENWREIATEMFKEGADIKNIMAELQISKKDHERYLAEEDYYDIIDNGMSLSEAFWIDWAKKNVGDKNVNTALFNSMMNRMFRWDFKAEKARTGKKEKEKGADASEYLQRYQDKSNKDKRYDA